MLKAELILSEAPDHDTLQAMHSSQYIMGTRKGITPFMALQWQEWLIKTGNNLPSKAVDTSLESLFFIKGVMDKPYIQTREEKRELYGEELYERIQKRNEFTSTWLEAVQTIRERCKAKERIAYDFTRQEPDCQDTMKPSRLPHHQFVFQGVMICRRLACGSVRVARMGKEHAK